MPKGDRLSYFTRNALIATLPGNDRLPGLDATRLHEFLKDFGREASPLLRLGLWASVVLYHFGPLLTVYLPVPALLLPQRLRERHLEKLCAHPWYAVRSLAFNLKMIAGLCWGRDTAVRACFRMPPLPPDPGTLRRP
ncbi:MAG: hypothetical protein IV100_35250 [Myxococcales bacterium]|nr:hypothetical protein [Myxococcales bacterium]